MKKFSELGIKVDEDKTIFNVPLISITDIVNCEIEVLDFTSGIKTEYGEGRYIIKIRYKNEESKFFTNSTNIKEMLDKVQKQDFPFLTTIVTQKYSGSKKSFYFT